jgi:hypothetical protein
MDTTYAELLVAFAMIGLLGVILRYTFSSAARGEDSGFGAGSDELPPGASEGSGGLYDLGLGLTEDTGEFPVTDYPVPHYALQPARDDGVDLDLDFGLLAPVAVTDTPEQARRIRDRLIRAGVRATTSTGRDGRPCVLVFASEMDKARGVGDTFA